MDGLKSCTLHSSDSLLCLSQPFQDIQIALALPAIPDAALVNSETPKSVFIVEEMH